MNDKNDKKRFGAVALVFGAIGIGILLAQFLPPDLLGLRHRASGSAMPEDTTGSGGQLWTCGMHPHVIEEEPGQCPICGMNLTPMRGGGGTHTDHDHAGSTDEWTCPDHPIIVESEPGTCPIDGIELIPAAGESAAGSGTTVEIDPAMVQNMNVRTETVTRHDLSQPIRTVGYLEYDQQRMVTVTTKYSGWVEKVYVNYVGEKVRRGQPLFEIYSPELVQTEQELLSALDFAAEMSGAPEDARERSLSMVESARIRLGYWDISPQQITRLEETGEVFRTLKVSAPSNGLVMKRMPGLEGMAVHPGRELFHIADLSSLWLSVELFEDQLAWVREGTPAQVSLSYFPGEAFRGKVRFLEPELSEKTRTMRAKIEVPNPGGRLRKGMYATVEFQPVIVRNAVAVPSQAVLRTGQRSVVVVALGEGRFAPRDVVLGHEAAGHVQILSGLDEGAEVVTSAQFLLDSESKLRDAIQKMIAGRTASRLSPSGGTDGVTAGHAGH